MKERKFYKVLSDLSKVPLRDHLRHGYEEEDDFYQAVRSLRDRWKNRVGEDVGERNGFVKLRFYDTPGGMPDEAWLPDYLIEKTEIPDNLVEHVPTPEELIEKEIDEAFGFF